MNHQSITTVILFLLSFNYVISQNLDKTRDDSDQLKYELVVDLDSEDFDKEFAIDVPSNAASIMYSVNGKITHGNLKVRVMDSNNKSEGMFHLTTQKKSGGHTTAKGNYENQMNHPIRGKWLVKVEAEEVVGDFKLNIAIDK